MFFDHYRLSHLDRDTSVWLNRPLTPDLEFGIVCDVIYLIELRRVAVAAMLKPMDLVTSEFLSVFREVCLSYFIWTIFDLKCPCFLSGYVFNLSWGVFW